MTDSTRLDASRLLGFGRDGAPLHELVIPAGADNAETAQGSVQAQGSAKPVGGVKPLGSIKPAGLGGKNLIVAAGIGGKFAISPAGIIKADGLVKS